MRDFIVLDCGFAQALQFFFKRRASRADVDLRILRVKPCADFAFGALADGEFVTQPVTGRIVLFRHRDLHGLTGLQRGVERHNLAVDLRAATAVADVGMNVVGKINWRCALRQLDHFGVRREYVNTRVLELDRGRFAQLFTRARFGLRREIVRQIGLPTDELAHPCDLRIVVALLVYTALVKTALFIAPMRRNPVFGELVHLLGADLHLHRSPVVTDHDSV